MTTAEEVRLAIAPRHAALYDGVEIGDDVIVTPIADSPFPVRSRAGQIAAVVGYADGDWVIEFPSGAQILALRCELARVD